MQTKSEGINYQKDCNLTCNRSIFLRYCRYMETDNTNQNLDSTQTTPSQKLNFLASIANQKGNFLVAIGIVILASVVSYFIVNQRTLSPTPVPSPKQVVDRDGEIALVPKYPQEYLIYQDYLRTIGDKPRISDIGTVEATVISITKSGVCPDIVDPFVPEPKECSIDPYPKDIGVVRIDKIISYIPYSEQTVEQPIEQPSGAEPAEEGKTTSGYRGKDTPGPKPLSYKPLQLGQEIPTSFLLTTRPVKIIYTSIPPAKESTGGLESSEQTTEHPLQKPLPKTYNAIPKSGDYFVFTTRIIKYPETSQKTLPGLGIGSKFRAAIQHDGSLYIDEYELIP